jgi:NAD(P)-dependent dehydrogenase (short-subunit alcohol dehydrogenase family)
LKSPSIACACAGEGAIPVIVDRDAVAGGHLRDELQDAGAAAHFPECDLCEFSNCQDAVREAAGISGRLDALVNNAGVNDRVGLEHGTPEQYVGSLKTNLLHYFNMAYRAESSSLRPVSEACACANVAQLVPVLAGAVYTHAKTPRERILTVVPLLTIAALMSILDEDE